MKKSQQVLRAIGGYAVTYKSDYKTNPFVVTMHGKVIDRFADFFSAVEFVSDEIGNFERLKERG